MSQGKAPAEIAMKLANVVLTNGASLRISCVNARSRPLFANFVSQTLMELSYLARSLTLSQENIGRHQSS